MPSVLHQALLMAHNPDLDPHDPYWAYVALACHFNGSNGSTVFTDQKGHTVSLYAGTPAITTSNSKFGGGSLLLPTSGMNHIQDQSPITLGLGDYTVDFWFRSDNATGTYGGVFNLTSFNPYGNNDDLVIMQASVSWSAEIRIAGSYIYGISNIGNFGSYPYNNWQFFAVSRVSGITYFFINGILTAQTSAVYNLPALYVDIGQWAGSSLSMGYMNDLRVTVGVGRYTTNFTPPVAPFPNQ